MKKALLLLFGTLTFLDLFGQKCSIDSSFNNIGFTEFFQPSKYTTRSSILEQNDGKLLVTGLKWISSFAPRYLFANRTTTNGKIDSSYGTNGIFEYTDALVTEIIYSESFIDVNNYTYILAWNNDGVGATYCGIILKLNPNGQFDNTFGQNGIVRLPRMSSGTIVYPYDIRANSLGEIVIMGKYYEHAPVVPKSFYIQKLNANGSLNTSFGSGSYKTFNQNNQFDHVQLENMYLFDSKYYLCGRQTDKAIIVRLDSFFNLDSTFAQNGVFLYDPTSGADAVTSICFLSDKSIVFSFRTPNINGPPNTTVPFNVAKLDSTGIFDTTFATNGVFSFDSLALDERSCRVMNVNDKILLAGECHYTGILFIMLDRGGIRDISFNAGGTFTAYDSTYGAQSVLLTYDYKIAISSITKGVSQSRISRFLWNWPSSLNDLAASNSSVVVYPNPASSKINIESNNPFDGFAIYSLNGQLIDVGKINSSAIDISSIQSGNYLLVLLRNTTRVSSKLISISH